MIYQLNLANNISVLCEEIDVFESVVIEVWVKVGSRHETPEINGISHFLEHLAFKGTDKLSARDIAIAFDSIGGCINAGTSRENTVYTIKILAEHLEFSITTLADILINSSYNQAEIERERNVIIQEIAQSNDIPDDLIFESFMATAFKDQSLGMPVIGSKANVNNFTRDNFIDFYDNHYRSSSLTIAAAGKLDHQEFFNLITKNFSNISMGTEIIEVPNQYIGGIKIIEDSNAEQAHMIIGCEALSYNHPDFLCQDLATNILGGSMSSRLFQEIREIRGLAYNISSFNYAFGETGIFGVYSDISEENITKTIKIIIEQINIIAEEITDEEIMRTKQQIKASFLMSKESLETITSRLGSNYTRFKKYINPEEILDKYLSYSKNDIQNYFRMIVKNLKNPTICVIINPNKLSITKESIINSL